MALAIAVGLAAAIGTMIGAIIALAIIAHVLEEKPPHAIS